MVKRLLGLMLGLLLLLCTAQAEKQGAWVEKYNPAPTDRMVVELPDGMENHAEINYSTGKIEVVIKASEMSRTDWRNVMIDGGYPYVSVRPGVQRPSDDYSTYTGFNGDIFYCVESDFFNAIANDLKNGGGWGNNTTVYSNGEQVGEIVAEQCMLIPWSSSIDGGGYFICWMNTAAYQEKYPEGHNFTADEIKANADGLFMFEYVEISVQLDVEEPFYVPFRSVSAAMMKLTESATMPSGISVKSIANGDITFLAKNLSTDVDVPVVFDAPAGATQLVVYCPGVESSWKDVEDRIAVINDRATYIHQVHQDVCVSEDQLAAVWLDKDGSIVDYGIFWFHVETPGYKPGGAYIENWSAVPESRVELINECVGLGVTTTYDQNSGIFHIGYEAVTEVTGDIGRVGIRVKAPEGATAARINHGGGNQIMGPREGMESSTHHIIVEQSYIKTQTVEKDGYITVSGMEPLRYYNTGPVDVYIQSESVWPYGGGQSVIYWYEDEEAAENDRGNPMKIEYVADTTGTICVTSRTEIVESEDKIPNKVEHVTCVRPGYGGKDWHLVIHRYPQRGKNACHWEFYLENECGDYEPLTENTVFYMPYPNEHHYDEEKGCAVDEHGNACTYAIYHYSSDYGDYKPVEAEHKPQGIRFVVDSLSPFVLDWGGYQGGNNNRPAYQLQNLRVHRGNTTVDDTSIRDVQMWSNATAQFNNCRLENASLDFNEEANGSICFKKTTLNMLMLPISNRTPTNATQAMVSFDADSRVECVYVAVLKDEAPTKQITGKLVAFAEGTTIQMLAIEGDYTVYNPAWFSGVTFVEVQYQDAENPVSYADFLAMLEKSQNQ